MDFLGNALGLYLIIFVSVLWTAPEAIGERAGRFMAAFNDEVSMSNTD